MVARITDVVTAYANTAGRGTAGLDARDRTAGGEFGGMVRDMLGDAVNAGQASERVAADALVGGADLTDVVMAVNNAELSLQTVVAIRDKVIEAYQEIIRMPI
ncbi:MAG: flagellar hook-basal body complex protein FliE [Alphaproteobacteria bacterium]